MQPEAVIFDIGNVLTHWQPEAFYDREIGAARRQALFAEVDLHAMNELVDAGGLFRETIYDWADRHPAWAAEVRMWYDRWIELASPRIEGSIALLRALRQKGVPVFALTNFGSYSYDEARDKLDQSERYSKRSHVIAADDDLERLTPEPMPQNSFGTSAQKNKSLQAGSTTHEIDHPPTRQEPAGQNLEEELPVHRNWS